MAVVSGEYEKIYEEWRNAEQAFNKASDNLRKITSPNWQIDIKNASLEIKRLGKLTTWTMKLEFAKTEIDRYVGLGIDRSDLACLIASWSLSSEDLEKANDYLHAITKKKFKTELQEGIIL